MILSEAVSRLASVITVGVTMQLFRMGLGWLDRHATAPIMRERINTGSDRFFDQEEKNWGRSEIDSILQGHFGEV